VLELYRRLRRSEAAGVSCMTQEHRAVHKALYRALGLSRRLARRHGAAQGSWRPPPRDRVPAVNPGGEARHGIKRPVRVNHGGKRLWPRPKPHHADAPPAKKPRWRRRRPRSLRGAWRRTGTERGAGPM